MQHSFGDAILLLIACILSMQLVHASMEGFKCDMTRNTGYSNHRSLNLPASFWDSASHSDRAWALKLCCIFTWVAKDSSTTAAFMITYDGGRQDYPDATTFAAVAEKVYSEVCGMSMGSQDCASQAERCPVTRSLSPRKYEAVGQLCRPKNNDGYAISNQVVSASACRDKCEADASRCGAFEYEYVAGDDRECELHEKGLVDRVATANMGACLLETTGGDALLDPPVLGQYRCCWVHDGAGADDDTSATTSATTSGASATSAATSGASATSITSTGASGATSATTSGTSATSSTSADASGATSATTSGAPMTMTLTSFTIALVSLSLASSSQQERSATLLTTAPTTTTTRTTSGKSYVSATSSASSFMGKCSGIASLLVLLHLGCF